MDNQDLADLIQERGITRLVHFTPLMNLISIIRQQKILPREQLRQYAKEHQDLALLDYIRWNDKKRLDHRLDCINLSVERINSYLLRSFRREYAEGEPWTILTIDPQFLLREGVVFTVGNAASRQVREEGTAPGAAGLRALFADQVCVGNSYGTRIYKRTPRMNPAYPNCIQAEVLFPGEIPLSGVTGLICDSDENRSIVKSVLSVAASDVPLPPITVDPNEFIDHA